MTKAWLFDAGNTLVFLDHATVAGLAGVPTERVARAEGVAKRTYERRLAEGIGHARGWDVFMSELLREAGAGDVGAALDAVRTEHARFNLWRRVPEGLPDALRRARERGARLGVVSNSEGALPALFARVGLEGLFEVIVDSHDVGVSKPDPRIFAIALERMELTAGTYVGDLPDVDLRGARAAGLDAVLYDALGYFPGVEPRIDDLVAWVDAIEG